MKRFITLSIITTMSLSTLAFANEIPTVTNQNITTTNGNVTAVPPLAIIDKDDVKPTAVTPLAVVDRETLEILVPIRTASEDLGYTITWDGPTQTIILTKGEDTFSATIGSKDYLYNGNVALTAPAPKLVKGSTYVSPQFINLITPYNNQPQIQDPTGSDQTDTDTDVTAPVEDPIATLGLSDEVIGNIYETINPIKDDLNEKINTTIAEHKEAYIGTGGTEEDYTEPSSEVGTKFINATRDYVCVNVYGYVSIGSSNSEDHYLTFNRKTGELETLENIYGDDYATFVKGRILAIANQQEETDPENYDYNQESLDSLEITNDTNFYINSDNQLVIVLPKYSVEAGSYGSPEFVITNYSNDLPKISD